MIAGQAPTYICGRSKCGAVLIKCHNYAVEQVCNRMTEKNAPEGLCDYCRLNDVIPDLSVGGNRDKWRHLEKAKRRLLYLLDFLGLPYGRPEDGVEPPLSFDFKSDLGSVGEPSWGPEGERVLTGHAQGKITINIREADPVEREKARVSLGEPQRTLIGHFRHEIGHYYWQMLVEGRRGDDFRACFGDYINPTYEEARQRYYRDGPVADWSLRFISAYASMHPWEDFAETFATYLDVFSVLDVANTTGLENGEDPRKAPLEETLSRYIELGVAINEINRSMGLTDLVPEVFVPAAIDKLKFVHRLVRSEGPR